ncbi:CAP domain-containing protein [Paenibacillus thailandensis]|uniref:CAP domain-containing protein n=1 Tax=Paenibacillus thailandensis TaxID=393250 RepID=A0ABW5QSU8_9BACL
MNKKSIRFGFAAMAAAALIGTGVMAPQAHAASAAVSNGNNKFITVQTTNLQQMKQIAAQYGIDLNKLLADLKNQSAKQGAATAQKPSSGTAAKPAAGTETQPSAGTTNEGSETTASKSDYAAQVVDLVNKERKAAGLPALKSDPLLTKVAVAKAKDMDVNNYFSHTSPTYGSPFDMMTEFGVKYSYAGENIASGQKTPQEVMDAWMNSEGHRKNILNPKFTKIGVGYVNGEWVQEFTG